MPSLSSVDLVANARAAIKHISVDEASQKLSNDDYVFVDVRDSAELETGKIPTSIHAHRGGLEFALDPMSNLKNEALVAGKTLVMICGSGGRAALATKLALDFGHNALCLEGGMKAWKESGAPLE